jgi:hypothetical protein
MIKIRPVRINSEHSVKSLLQEVFPDIPDDMYMVDIRSGKLYVAKGADLYSLHNPYGGEHIRLNTDLPLQTFAGPREAWLCQSLHTVFEGKNGALTDSEGIELEARPCVVMTWSRAIIDLAFVPNKT